MTTRVIHFRDWDRNDPNQVYIGRAVPRKGLKASRWANPFPIGSKRISGEVVSRTASLSLFESWVRRSFDTRAVWIREHVHELRDKTLVCWCKPAHECHGDILAEMADSSVEAGV